MNASQFISLYPVSLKEIMVTPLVFREYTKQFQALPYPRMAHIRDIAEYAGYAYGTLRTALSRACRAGDLISFTDARGTVRYRLADLQRSVARIAGAHADRAPGFTLAVFSFATEQHASRNRLRQILGWYGFKKLASNVYITGSMDSAELELSARKAGVADHLYLFSCTDNLSTALSARLRVIFDIEKRKRKVEQFLRDIREFLAPAYRGMEFARRFFYAGPVHHKMSFTSELPFSRDILPPDYPADELKQVMRELAADRGKDLIIYYQHMEEEGGKE
jgi:DNA-binding transcriptional regulator PaaX